MRDDYKIVDIKKVKKYKDDRFKDEPWYKGKNFLEVELKIESKGKIIDKTFILDKEDWKYIKKKGVIQSKLLYKKSSNKLDDPTSKVIDKNIFYKNAGVLPCQIADSDLAKINRFTLEDVKAEDVFIFKTVVGDNELDDRNYEPFNLKALQDLSSLYIGKTVLKDHNRSSDNQVARIFDTELIKDYSKITGAGEVYTKLITKQYMVKTKSNKDLILDIKGGIKKEVSTGFQPKAAYCSICGTDNMKTYCPHRPGREYDTKNGKKTCYLTLSGAKEAYELSLVAVPAQPRAGTTKGAYNKNIKEDKNKEEELRLRLLKSDLKLLDLTLNNTEDINRSLKNDREENVKENIMNKEKGKSKLDNKKNFRNAVKEVLTSSSNNGSLIGFDELEFQASPTEFDISALLDELPSEDKEGQIPVEAYYHGYNINKADDNGNINIEPKDYVGLDVKDFNTKLAGFIDIFPSYLFEDAYNVVNAFVDRQVQDKLVNYNNKRIVDTIINSCAVSNVSNINNVLNSIKTLPAKARKRTYIITNTDGFNALDTVDASGNKLITKNSEGDFILDDKYPIIELDNRLLETDITNGIPIVYGDIKTSIKKIKYKDKKMLIKEFTRDGIDDEIHIKVLINDAFVSICNECIGAAYYKAN